MTQYMNGTYATINVEDGDSREWPVVERGGNGWQSGAHYYPDDVVRSVRVLHVLPTDQVVAIKAEALREAARDTRERGDIGKEGGVEAWDYLRGRADRLLGMCPTCSGPVRETVNMRCETCGRDFIEDTE